MSGFGGWNGEQSCGGTGPTWQPGRCSAPAPRGAPRTREAVPGAGRSPRGLWAAAPAGLAARRARWGPRSPRQERASPPGAREPNSGFRSRIRRGFPPESSSDRVSSVSSGHLEDLGPPGPQLASAGARHRPSPEPPVRPVTEPREPAASEGRALQSEAPSAARSSVLRKRADPRACPRPPGTSSCRRRVRRLRPPHGRARWPWVLRGNGGSGEGLTSAAGDSV